MFCYIRQLKQILVTCQHRLSFGGSVNPTQNVHQRQFTTPIGAKEAKNSIFRNIKWHIREGVELTIVTVWYIIDL